MLRPALPLLLASAVACTPGARAPAPPAPAPAADPYAACWSRDEPEACVVRTERELLAAAGGEVRREGGRLVFRGTRGGSLSLEDDATEGERWVRYRYAGRLPAIAQHLVQMGFYEGGGWLLVSAETTDQTQVLGPPVVAPDASRFVAASVDLEAGYDPNGIQVWSLARGFPRLEWGLDGGDGWGASDAVWIDARTVEFTRHVNDTGDPDRTRRVRTRLVLGEDGVALRPAGR
ncbi:MAG TPA: hypothetical protein VHG51_04290 [Longimicrobiaceae bacterium]|nr:hypothetical protein [Longimicrobiaceae bacterium]